jgi:hypothetical protein
MIELVLGEMTPAIASALELLPGKYVFDYLGGRVFAEDDASAALILAFVSVDGGELRAVPERIRRLAKEIYGV